MNTSGKTYRTSTCITRIDCESSVYEQLEQSSGMHKNCFLVRPLAAQKLTEALQASQVKVRPNGRTKADNMLPRGPQESFVHRGLWSIYASRNKRGPKPPQVTFSVTKIILWRCVGARESVCPKIILLQPFLLVTNIT